MFCNDDQLHPRVLGYPKLALLRVVHSLVCPTRNERPVAIFDYEETCYRLLGLVEVIMSTLSTTYMSSQEEQAKSLK